MTLPDPTPTQTPLAELFERDPLELTTADLDRIIARYREASAQWQAGVRAAGSTKKVSKPIDPDKALAADSLLKSLGL